LIEASTAEFSKQVVQRGDGVSFVVREAVATELQEGKLATVPIRGPKVYLDVSIAYLKDQHLSLPAQAFTQKAFRKVKNSPSQIENFMTKE
jgi:DNA-binding transcriptional LysR family regulator